MPPKFQCHAKICTVGATGVGKTSLMIRFALNQFIQSQPKTKSICFHSRKVNLRDHKEMEMQVWDMPNFTEIDPNHNYFKNVDGIIIIWDSTRPETLQPVPLWIEQIQNLLPDHVVIIIAASKTDLVQSNQELIKKTDEYYEKKLQMRHLDYSCATGRNVLELHNILATQIHIKQMQKIQQLKIQGVPEILQHYDEQYLQIHRETIRLNERIAHSNEEFKKQRSSC